MNYQKLMEHEPTKLGSFTNSKGQIIDFYEHPIKGDSSEVICVCHELQLASTSDFFELDDMTAEHGEYEPLFLYGKFVHGMPSSEELENMAQSHIESNHP